MRHTRLFAIIFLLVSACILSGSAFADSMSFTGVGGNNLGGVYTYPYQFSVNGGPTVGLLCDAFDFEISVPETWTANENTVASAATSGLFSGLAGAATDYIAAGLIFDSMLNINGNPLGISGINTNDANWAIWAIFSTNGLNDIKTGNASSPFGTAGDPNALNIYNQALSAAVSAPDSDFNGIVIYTPVAGTQSGNLGTPQEFFGYAPVPEPGELSFLGILMLAGAGAFTFRKQLAENLATR